MDKIAAIKELFRLQRVYRQKQNKASATRARKIAREIGLDDPPWVSAHFAGEKPGLFEAALEFLPRDFEQAAYDEALFRRYGRKIFR